MYKHHMLVSPQRLSFDNSFSLRFVSAYFTRFTLLTSFDLFLSADKCVFPSHFHLFCLLLNRNLNCFKTERKNAPRLLETWATILPALYIHVQIMPFDETGSRTLTCKGKKANYLVPALFNFSIYLGLVLGVLFWLSERFNNYLWKHVDL